MTLQEAGHSLHEHLTGNKFYQVVGIAENPMDGSPSRLIVYLIRKPPRSFVQFTSWEGFPVKWTVSGGMRLL